MNFDHVFFLPPKKELILLNNLAHFLNYLHPKSNQQEIIINTKHHQTSTHSKHQNLDHFHHHK